MSPNKRALSWLASGLCAFLTIFATTTGAGEMPSLSVIVSNVAKATLPAQGYSATVHQTVSRGIPNATVSTKSGSAQGEVGEEADYAVKCPTSGVLRATKGISLKRAAKTANEGEAEAGLAQNTRMMISVNPLNALRRIESLPSATITEDECQGIPCHKISSPDNRFGFILWVSKADSCVCRQIVLQDGSILFDTQFEYKKWNGGLVPARVVTTKPSNGIRVEQTYSGQAR